MKMLILGGAVTPPANRKRVGDEVREEGRPSRNAQKIAAEIRLKITNLQINPKDRRPPLGRTRRPKAQDS